MYVISMWFLTFGCNRHWGKVIKLLFTALLSLVACPASANDVHTRIIDTDAGHASVTKMPNGQVFVFDAGRQGSENHIIEQITELSGTRKIIDLLVLSHTDADHVSAVPAIFSDFEVKQVLRTGLERCPGDESCVWRSAHDAIRKSVDGGKTIDLNLKKFPIGHGYVFEFGEVSIQMLSGFYTPPRSWGLRYYSSDWKNAGSIVMRLDFDGKSILFTGDEWGKEPGEHDLDGDHGVGEPADGAEKYMIENHHIRSVKADVYIASHHGADDANSYDFVKLVAPKYIILPSGNRHQHPRYRTVRRIQLATGVSDVDIFRTDRCDKPGPKEWPYPWVDGADDIKNDDDIDVYLITGVPDVKVKYVSNDTECIE